MSKRRKHNPKKGVPMPRWRSRELSLLRQHYPYLPNSDVAWLVGRSLKSVQTMASRLGLRKSAARLEEMGRQNVASRWGRA